MHALFAAVLSFGLLGTSAIAAPAGPYRQSVEKNCDGYRSISITSAPGTCVSLIAANLGFPRGVLTLPDDQVLVVDMGSWERGRGRLLLVTLSPTGDAPVIKVLATRLDRPHGIARGSDGRIYLGEATRISEVKLGANAATLTPVLVGAPGTGRHPLIGLAVMNDGRIAFSTGSASDDCDGRMVGIVCQEAVGPQARAAIRVFMPAAAPVRWRDVAPFATGLRNSAALTFDPVAEVLWGGENGMDLPSALLPPDELNKIEADKNYGWPACYGMAVRARGFGGSTCAGTAVPARNLPAHSAPLGATIIEGGVARAGRAIVLAMHGYQPTGHRVALIPINARGDLSGPSRDLISGWTQMRGVRPTGTPVGVAPASRGGLYVTEDGNGTLLRVSVRAD